MRTTKKSLAATLSGTLVSLGLLVGTTFAWYNEKVETNAATLTSGTMQAKLYWTDDFEGGVWRDAAEEAIFSTEGWRPGKSEVRYIKVENAGTLPFDYQFYLSPKGEYDELAKAVRLYEEKDPIAENITLQDMEARLKISSITNAYLFSEGTLKVDENFVTAIALKINDTLSDEYIGKNLGDGFVIRVDTKQRNDESTYQAGTPIRFNNDDPEEPDTVEKFALVFPNTDKYLYRVGNANAVALASLFEPVNANAKARSAGAAIDTANVSVEIEKLYQDTDVEGTFTANASDWTKGTIQFTGTGPVKLTITDGDDCAPTELLLEVVNASNFTSESNLGNLQRGNSVLLSDLVMPENGSVYIPNATVYGNGFTFDVTAGAHGNTAGNISNNGVLILLNAVINNLKIVGAVYTEYGATAKDDYNFPIVLSSGTSAIINSYVSNGASPVRIREGNLTIENTTLKGGNFANLDIRAGQVVLDNVTTINQADSNDAAADGSMVVGLGIVAYYEGTLADSTITIKNGLTQYNSLCSADSENIPNSFGASIIEQMMAQTDYVYTDATGTKWVNTGIVSLQGDVFGRDNIIGNVDNYKGGSTTVTILGTSRDVFIYAPDASCPKATAPDYKVAGQAPIAPDVDFDHSINTWEAPADSPNDYCYYDGEADEVVISFDEGDSVEWNTAVLTVSKNGNNLPYTVKMNGTDYTGKTIPFDAAGKYVVEYSYSDDDNYSVLENGSLDTYSKPYTQTVTISVSAVKAAAKHASFAFGVSGASAEKKIDGISYVMPNVTAADGAEIGSISVGNEVEYFPIVNARIIKSGTSKVYAVFYIFSDIVTITDYAEGGTGAAVTYDAATTSMPDNLSVEKGVYGENPDVTTWTSKSDTNLTQNGGDYVFRYLAGTSNLASLKTHDDKLCYQSDTLNKSGRENEVYTIAKYKYVDNAGVTYYYYVGYKVPSANDAESDSSSSGNTCVTPDTLITLADGSQVMVKDLKGDEELLVWNFFTGKAEVSPLLCVDKDPAVEYEVIYLTFSDGTIVKVISEHGFYDVDENKYVYLDREAGKHIGHRFMKSGQTVTLEKVELKREVTEALSPVSYGHLCCYVNGMLSMPGGIDGMFNYFAVDPATMKYDEAAMQADIEKYGILTYEEFAELFYPSEFMYNAIGAKYVKVTVGKGLTTIEKLKVLCDRYLKFFTE